MIDQVSFDGTTFAAPPQRFGSGYSQCSPSDWSRKSYRIYKQFDISDVVKHENKLHQIATTGLSKIEGFVEHGTTPNKAAVLSFNIEGIHPHDLATFLDAQGIAIRTGHHCCQPLMKVLG